jgi:hypothetical protein
MSCLDNIPFSAVVGFILIVAGGGIMAGTLHEGFMLIDKWIADFFINISDKIWIINIVNFCLCGTVILLGLFILIFGCIVTSGTKHKIYRDDRCMMGGRCSAAFFMFVVHIALIFWLVITLLLCVPCLAFLIIHSVCRHEKQLNLQRTYFNLTNYGIYLRPYLHDSRENYREAIESHDDFVNFCDNLSPMIQFFLCALGGSVCVFNGLIFLLGSLSSYHTKLRLTSELTKCRRDMDYIYHQGDRIQHEAFPLTGRNPPTAPFHHDWVN